MPIIKENINLSPYSAWRVGGYADFFAEPQSIEDIKWIETQSKNQKWPITIIGGGTNCLISDDGLKGLVISLKKLVGITSFVEDDFLKIECLAGTPKLLLMKKLLKYQLAPAIFLSGIPGCVGGGVVMNAGVSENIMPYEFSQIVDWIDIVYDYQVVRKKHSDIKWSYRSSGGWQPGIITRVGFKWPLQPIEHLSQKVKQARDMRLSKQPLKDASCGSTFINPKKHTKLSAGQLIEQSGLKGFQIGQAKVSDKHANFIVNLGKATAWDIHSVISHVQKSVYDKTGILLQTEIKYLGNWE